MPQLLTANIGSYPRIGEEKDHQRYRRGLNHFETKQISAHAFRDVEQSVAQEIIHEQLNASVDEVTDGLIAWHDPISHFCKNVSGFERRGLNNYFSTNFYYREPWITARPKWKGPVVASEYQYAQSVSNRTVRAVVTGPLTLATHTDSKIKSYANVAKRLDLFTELIGNEIKALIKAGARSIQIDEPSLAADPKQFALIKKSFQKMIPTDSEVCFILALYYGDLAPLWAPLQDLPVRGLNLDFTRDGEKLIGLMLAKPGTKEIGLGLVDARNTRLENQAHVVDITRRWMEKSPAARTFLTPSSGLEQLPRTNAQAKLQLLNAARHQIQTPNETVLPANS